MQVRLLGPIDVVVGGEVRSPAGQRRIAILAALALTPGTLVSVERLIDIVWPDAPPATAVNTVQSHVSYLRRLLGDRAVLRSQPPGYVLDVDTDVRAAERLLREVPAAGEPGRRAARLRAALDLWRGPTLADVAAMPWFDGQARQLDDVRLRARQDLAEARMDQGEHRDAVADLEDLRGENPTHERIHELLMVALYRAGRPADALAVHRDLRRRLDEELGLEPGAALHDLETAILRQDPRLHRAPAETVRPAQLPPAVAGFAGRRDELSALDRMTAGTPPVTITVVDGTGGVGKTALAVHWAHRAAPRFPDGQLYVDLRGFSSEGVRVDPTDALYGFLTALGVPTDRIPTGLDARSGLYRSLLAGQRVLVLIDNARDAAQVRPLLPGTPDARTLVTSRNQLTALVTTEGAALVPLDVLSAADAHELLAHRVGSARIAAEPAAAADIVARCDGLPLALALAAARAAMDPRRPIATVAAGLTAQLDAFDIGDPNTDLRAVFSWSYRTLTDDAARLFRLLGLRAGPDITAAAAASLAGLPPERLAPQLTELTRAHLLTELSPGRYGAHDLLCSYASEQAYRHEPEETRRAALGRLVDHYRHSAQAAARQLDVTEPATRSAEPLDGVRPERPGDLDDAMRWFVAEHAVLTATVRDAAAAGLHEPAWQLASAMRFYLDRRRQWDDLAAMAAVGLDAARRDGDLTGQSLSLRALGLAAIRQDRLADADAHTRAALALAGRAGDDGGQGRAHLTLAWLAENAGDHRGALGHGEEALACYRTADDRAGQARALGSLGWNHAELGDHTRAVSWYAAALALHEASGDLDGEATTWEGLGVIHRRHGDLDRAVEAFRSAADRHGRLGRRHSEATVLDALGDTYDEAGDRSAARDAWSAARSVFDEIGAADAAAGPAAKLAG